MKSLKRYFLSTLVMLLLFGTGPALAQMGGPHGGSDKKGYSKDSSKGHGGSEGYGKGHRSGPSWRDSLSKKQKKMADQMHLQLKIETSELNAAKALRKAELNNLIISESPDMAAIGMKIGEIVDLKKQLMLIKYSHKVEMRAMLNPDQRNSFDMSILGGGHGRR